MPLMRLLVVRPQRRGWTRHAYLEDAAELVEGFAGIIQGGVLDSFV